MSARHAHPNVRTEQDYRNRQAEAIKKGMDLYPNLPWKAPWVNDLPLEVFVSGGRWLVECPCGNCPMVAPEWGNLALCYECGAIYDKLVMPVDAHLIEAMLVLRKTLGLRYWNPGITLQNLQEENVKLGVG